MAWVEDLKDDGDQVRYGSSTFCVTARYCAVTPKDAMSGTRLNYPLRSLTAQGPRDRVAAPPQGRVRSPLMANSGFLN
jgi:hypothetical protein